MSAMTGLALRTGEKVLIDGRLAEARDFVDEGRVFLFPETGNTAVYGNVAQVCMAREGRLTTTAAVNALSAGRREALGTDLAAFAPEMQDLMLWRYGFVMAVDALPRHERRTKKGIAKAIEAKQADLEAKTIRAVLEPAKNREVVAKLRPEPTVRMVGIWHKTFHAAGRDVRALVDLSYRKGRRDQLLGWIREEIHRAIDQVYATQPPGDYAATRTRANTLVRARAAREGLRLPQHGGREPVGKNAVKRVLESDYEVHDVLVRRFGKAEADRIMEAVEKGPKARWPLHQVEVDHTQLDFLVVDRDEVTVLGRPWLTALRDRFSGCVIGVCLSFHPPSWTTVMEALRFGVVDKCAHLARLGGINESWDCFGAPDELICDNGKEFHSASMQATEAALNMRVTYVPRRKGWLKGRIERWFGTLERQVVHTIAGTTLSDIKARKHYDAVAGACLTLEEGNWVIAKWIVDIDHQDDREGRRTPPAELWARGMRERGAKTPPPRELLSPLTGLTVPAVLSREGVRAKGLQWNSNAFSSLRNRIGTNEQVTLRIDTLDLQRAWVLDEARMKWVEGDLKTDDVGVGETLHQYEVIKAAAKRSRQPGEDKKAAIARSRGELFDYIQARVDGAGQVRSNRGRKKPKVEKTYLRFRADGRKPHEHIADTRVDAIASAGPIGSHAVGDAGDHRHGDAPARGRRTKVPAASARPEAPPPSIAGGVQPLRILYKSRRT